MCIADSLQKDVQFHTLSVMILFMKQVDFENGNTAVNIAQQAVPMFVAQVINLLYSIVDRIYIARIPGEGTAALGGIGLCFPVITLITAFTNLYGSGGAPLFAIARGRRRDDEATRIMNTSFRLEIMTGLVLMILGSVFARPILYAFGASDLSIPYALAYLRIYILGTLFVMTATGMNPFINAQGFSQVGMLTVTIGAVANILLDPIFIFVLGLGGRGAALATILSQGLSALFAFRFLTSPSSAAAYRLQRKGQRLLPELKTSLNIISLGLSAFVMQFTNGLVTAVCNSVLMTWGGEIYVSVMTILSSLRQVMEVPVFAVVEGASPILSYNYGARRPARVREGMKIMALAAGIYTLFCWLAVERFPAVLLKVFTADPVLTAAALPAMHLYFFAFIFMTFQHSAQTTFKALGKKNKAIFFSLFRKVIIVVPLTILLPRYFGLGTDGVFIAEPISNVIGGLAAFTTMLLTVLPELREMEK